LRRLTYTSDIEIIQACLKFFRFCSTQCTVVQACSEARKPTQGDYCNGGGFIYILYCWNNCWCYV